ncbi:hypothetical protein ACJX0J_025282, partial [Zea mays]
KYCCMNSDNDILIFLNETLLACVVHDSTNTVEYIEKESKYNNKLNTEVEGDEKDRDSLKQYVTERLPATFLEYSPQQGHYNEVKV